MVKKEATAKTGKTTRAILSVLLLVQVAFWIFSALMYLKDTEVEGISRIVTAVLMFLNSAGFLVLVFLIGRLKPLVFFVTVGFIALNIALTLTDQVGGWDYFILGLNVITFILYLWYAVSKIFTRRKKKS